MDSPADLQGRQVSFSVSRLLAQIDTISARMAARSAANEADDAERARILDVIRFLGDEAVLSLADVDYEGRTRSSPQVVIEASLGSVEVRQRAQPGKLNQRAALLAILTDAEDEMGYTTNELVALMQDRHGCTTTKNSVGSQLSKLAAKKRVRHVDNRWYRVPEAFTS